MGLKEAMASPDRENWIKSVEKEYERMVQDGVLKAVDATKVKAEGKRPITSNWTFFSQTELIGHNWWPEGFNKLKDNITMMQQYHHL